MGCNNKKKITEFADAVKGKLESEIHAGRITGPFIKPPFYPFHVSPFNIRPKKTPGKYRLIHDLSFPSNEDSVNAIIPQESKTVKYSKIHDAIKLIMGFPREVFMAKTDIADAYHTIPIHPSEYPKLAMTFQGKWYYDKNLPQGCGSWIFETALQAIIISIYYLSNDSHVG